MVSLVDLGPMTRDVMLNGKKIATVNGVSAGVIMTAIADNPTLRLIFAERRVDADGVMQLIQGSPVLMAKLVAAGLGKPDDAEAIDEVIKLPAGVTAILLKEIAEVTFPQGLQNFIDGLSSALDAAGVSGGGPTKGADGKSPAPSTPSSAQDTHQEMPGATPPDSSSPGQS